MQFQNRLRLLLDGLGTLQYTVPAHPRTRLADFYLLELLGSGQPRTPSQRSDQLEYELRAVAQTLIPALKEHLLQVAGYALARELRHVTNRAGVNYLYGMQLAAKLGVSQAVLDAWEYGSAMRELTLEDYRSVAHAGAQLFDSRTLQWTPLYGGQRWQLAAETWLQLDRAHTLSEMTIYIDRLYSIEHNTGALLNKRQEYSGEWLKYMLDLKRQARPADLLPYASGFMRQLARRLLYDRHYD